MQTFLILGTGTDIGKTFVTQTLIREAREQGKSVCAFKPVQTGWDAENAQTDTRLLVRALGLQDTEEQWSAISPLRFHAPLAPSMAAEREGRILTHEEVVAHCIAWQRQHEMQHYNIGYIETAGGVMSPLDRTHTMLDLATELQFSLILVAGTYLGALSHTLTAYEVIRHKDLALHSLIVNESEHSIGLEATRTALEPYIHTPIRLLARGERS